MEKLDGSTTDHWNSLKFYLNPKSRAVLFLLGPEMRRYRKNPVVQVQLG